MISRSAEGKGLGRSRLWCAQALEIARGGLTEHLTPQVSEPNYCCR